MWAMLMLLLNAVGCKMLVSTCSILVRTVFISCVVNFQILFYLNMARHLLLLLI